MEEILNRIRENRKKKGFSYENMANELNISIAAYRKIELNQTKLTVEKLLKIVEILDAKADEIMGIESNKKQKQSNFENSIGYQQQIENYFQENKERNLKIEELYESRLRDKEDIIKKLETQLQIK